MAYNTVPGAFRQAQGVNCMDAYNGAGTLGDAQLTAGATLLDRISLPASFAPEYASRWQLQNISFTSYLTILHQGVVGKLGKVMAGAYIDPNIQPSQTGSSAGIPYSPIMKELPQDPNLLVSLWDPAQEPLPPANTLVGTKVLGPSQLLPVTATLQLPTPLRPTPIVDVIVGIWITPSLITVVSPGISTGLNFYVCNSIYNLGYDDGH